MEKPIGAAGRAARDLARRRLGAQPAQWPGGVGSLPLVQAAEGAEPAAVSSGGPAGPGLPMAAPAAEASERERPAVSAEALAERVYRLLCRDLRLERERRGRW